MITSNDILEVTKGKLISGTHNNNLKKLCLDSRKIEKNDIFVAIKGKNVNSNKFIKEIINEAGAIITTQKIILKSQTPIIKVKNINKALLEIGALYRDKYIDKPLIAITGSVGKTTTKEIINNIFKQKYQTLKTEGNLNNNIGVPLMLSRITEKTDIIILELGMNHEKEIETLSKICKPNIGIITNIGTSHIGNLKTQDNIFKAKMEITSGMNNGILIVNGEDKYLKNLKDGTNYQVIKTNNETIKNININEKLNFEIKNKQITFPIPNKSLINNILLSIELANIFNIKPNDIINAINTYKPLEKRMNIINLKNNITIIDDCYNACLESIIGALSVLKNTDKNKIAIIGDILELGKHKNEIHSKIKLELNKIENLKIITVGKNTKKIPRHFKNNSEIIKYLSSLNIENTEILIKGSRKMKLEEIRDYLLEKYNI